LQAVCDTAALDMQQSAHGDLPRWRTALQRLPATQCILDGDLATPRLGKAVDGLEDLRDTLMSFHPWRKGPLELGGVVIDTEWRSDWKWERVRPHVDLHQERILDIGCGNGYFGWRMLAAGAKLVVGIDPTLVFVMQWLACHHFAGDAANFVLPLGIEDLPPGPAGFDTVFSMGVLYHRRDPVEHLQQIRGLLRAGGRMVLETLILPAGENGPVLMPESRYARMRNVWAVPTLSRLLEWVDQAGFRGAKTVDVTVTTIREQRSTSWMNFESLADALDPLNPGRTLEGYPAPTRAVIIARA
jgi:tRNA (mo5U34)-methyltransferase